MHSQAQCAFLTELPAEIRQVIYSFALTSNETITDPRVPNTDRDKPVLGLALAATCQNIHDELDYQIFYSINQFSFTHPNKASDFFNHLRKAQKVHLLQEISFDLRNSLTPAWAKDTRPPELIFHRGSRYTEWSHYLTCILPIEARGSPTLGSVDRAADAQTLYPYCHLNDNLHFFDEVSILRGLKVVILDLSGLQESGIDAGMQYEQCERRMLAFIATDIFKMDTCLAEQRPHLATKLKIRMLDYNLKPLEIIVPAETRNAAIRTIEEQAHEVRRWVSFLHEPA